MPDSIGTPQLCRMLLAAVDQIRANHEMLSRLDGAIGDGDHGTSILRAMEAVAKTIAENPGSEPKPLFAAIAWAVMGCDGGSTGPLFGSFFLGLADGAADQTTFDCAALAALFDAGISKLQQQSRAQTGDKTMMDAFLPALAALKLADGAHGIKAAMEQAAAAAASGAEATRDMIAKFGRARNLGDRTLGHPDPGAVSVSLIFKGFSEGV